MDEKPKFCSVCGQGLKDKTKKVDAGFNPLTGEAVKLSWPMVVCPVGHERWERNPDNVKFTWEKWEG